MRHGYIYINIYRKVFVIAYKQKLNKHIALKHILIKVRSKTVYSKGYVNLKISTSLH